MIHPHIHLWKPWYMQTDGLYRNPTCVLYAPTLNWNWCISRKITWYYCSSRSHALICPRRHVCSPSSFHLLTLVLSLSSFIDSNDFSYPFWFSFSFLLLLLFSSTGVFFPIFAGLFLSSFSANSALLSSSPSLCFSLLKFFWEACKRSIT